MDRLVRRMGMMGVEVDGFRGMCVGQGESGGLVMLMGDVVFVGLFWEEVKGQVGGLLLY